MKRVAVVLCSAAVLLAAGTTPASAGPNGDPVCAFTAAGCGPSVHEVQRGEWLWKIARATLQEAGLDSSPVRVRKVADAIYADNRRVIGPNKHRLRVGQRLRIRDVYSWPQ